MFRTPGFTFSKIVVRTSIDWFIDCLIDWLIDLHWVRALNSRVAPRYVQVYFNMFYMHRCRQSCRWKSVIAGNTEGPVWSKTSFTECHGWVVYSLLTFRVYVVSISTLRLAVFTDIFAVGLYTYPSVVCWLTYSSRVFTCDFMHNYAADKKSYR
jgi:hypothetical protein